MGSGSSVGHQIGDLALQVQEYLSQTVAANATAEDAITGKRLRIEDQALSIGVSSIDFAKELTVADVEQMMAADTGKLQWKGEVTAKTVHQGCIVRLAGNEIGKISKLTFQCTTELFHEEWYIAEVQTPSGTRSFQSETRSGRTDVDSDIAPFKDINAVLDPRSPLSGGAEFPEDVQVACVGDLLPLLLGSYKHPILIRAGPGTGKTWAVQQLAFLLAKTQLPLPEETQFDSKAVATGMLPFVIYVQRFAQFLQTDSKPTFRAYLDWECRNNRHQQGVALSASRVQLVMRAYEKRSLVVMVDGIDEAGDLRHLVEQFVLQELSDVRVVATSRPEGVRLADFYGKYVFLDLAPLTEEQQRDIVKVQLEDSMFCKNLMAVSKIRALHDKVFESQFSEADQQVLKSLSTRDRFRLESSTGFDPDMRQKTIDGSRIVAAHQGNTLRSQYLCELDRQMSKILHLLEREICSTSDLAGKVAQAGFDVDGRTINVAVRLCMLLRKRQQDCSSNAGAADHGLTVASLWRSILERSDEIYEACEPVKVHFGEACRELLLSAGFERGAELDSTLQIAPDFKDPVRMHEKAIDDYADRFPPSDLPEACVTDVLRARVVCRTAAKMAKLLTMITNGVELQLPQSGNSAVIECIRLKNKFKSLDPTHFRNCLCNLRLTVVGKDGQSHSSFVEMQIHHTAIIEHNEESHAHDCYDYFRSLLRCKYDDDLEQMLWTIINFFDHLKGVPVLLSVLIAFLQGHEHTSIGNREFTFPTTLLELYQGAVKSILERSIETPEELDVAVGMFRRLCTANMCRQRRVFTSEDVLASFNKDELQLWSHWADGIDAIPMVKTICSAVEFSGGVYQLKHLSLQEALAAWDIIQSPIAAQMVGPVVMQSPISFFLNMFTIGADGLRDALGATITPDLPWPMEEDAYKLAKSMGVRPRSFGGVLVGREGQPASSEGESKGPRYGLRECQGSHSDDVEEICSGDGILYYILTDDAPKAQAKIIEHGNLKARKYKEHVRGTYDDGGERDVYEVDGFRIHRTTNTDYDDYGSESRYYGFDGTSRRFRADNVLELAIESGHLQAARAIQDGLAERGEHYVISEKRFLALLSPKLARICDQL